MRVFQKWLCLILCLALALSVAPAALAESAAETASADDVRFAGKTWEEVLRGLMDEYGTFDEGITAGYYNTVTGEEHYFRGDVYMVSGSMYKVPLNMFYAEKIASGEMQWTDTVGGIDYRRAQEWTIVNSNNDMAASMWKAMGGYREFREGIAKYMGVDIATAPDPYFDGRAQFTAEQMIFCLKELYFHQDKYPGIIENMLKAERSNYFLRNAQSVEVAHKYGWFIPSENQSMLYMDDCAIVYTEDPILIVLNTAGIHNPYAFMADFCTLMIDYTEYHTAQRYIQAAAEQEAAAIAALNGDSVEPAATDAPATGLSGTEPAPAAPSTAMANKKTGDAGSMTLLLSGAVLAAAVLLCLSLMRLRVRWKRGWATAAAVLTAAALLLAVNAPSLKSMAAAPKENPQETVINFFDALSRQDYREAYSYLDNYSSLGLENTANTVQAQLLYDALRGSYSYSLYGSCTREGLTAHQQILLRSLDLKALSADLKGAVNRAMESETQGKRESELVDENGDYLSTVTGAAYSAAIESLLNTGERYTATSGLELELRYENGAWRIVVDQKLLAALSGGAYGEGGETA